MVTVKISFIKIYLPAIALIVTIFCSCGRQINFPEEEIDASLKLAAHQYKLLEAVVPDTILPRSVNEDGTLRLNEPGWWTSGFFPGSLWYLYEFTKNDSIRLIAKKRSIAIEKEKWNDYDHDIGFKFMCSFGNALRITGDSSAIPVIITAAQTLLKRYDASIGLIRSWGSTDDTTEYLVIIDNMMNLELLFAATRFTGDSSFYKIAVSHADKTMANHFREDGSSFHVVDYNKQGEVKKRKTVQGYSDESAWARGQAWGLYGYVMCYRETGNKKYLEQANKIAGFILNHPNLPEDKIPYWDFNAPDIPDSYRDASAAAINASALLELKGYVDKENSEYYYSSASQILENLSKSPYRSVAGENQNFLLKHSVGHLPAKSEIDVPLSYADYYYLEGLLRLKDTY